MAAPTCTTEAPTLIGQDFVTLNGVLVTTGGKPCTVRFWYKREDSPNWTTTPWGTGGGDGSPFELTLVDQHPHGAYVYAAQVANDDGSDYGLVIRWWYRWKVSGYLGSPFFPHGYQAIGPYEHWIITLQTDVCCHLTMHVDNNVPYRRKGEHFKRGIVYMHTPLTYFTPKWEIDQEEPGDSTSHTFLWTCQKPYGKYTFQATGTVDGLLSPSKSPFYYIRCKPTPPPVETSDQCTHPTHNRGYAQYYNGMSQTFSPDHDYQLIGFDLRLNRFSTERYGPYRVKLTLAGGDCWTESTLFQQEGESWFLPPPGSQAWTSFSFAAIPLTAGTTYRIVVHTIPGWFYWSQERWKPGDDYAAMMWWGHNNPDCYTRGSGQYGCDFKNSRYYWRDWGGEQNFVCWEFPSP